MVSTAPAAAATCRRCFGRGWSYAEGGWGQFPYEVPCACTDPGDDDAPDDDDCRAEDDLHDAAPDDATRFAFVARYPDAA